MQIEKELSKRSCVDELVEAFDLKLLKTLSEPVRLQILRFLLLNGRSDIGTIADNMPQDRSVISRHLNLMHESGILICEKESRHMFYRLNGQAFLSKLEDLTERIRNCMTECCPTDL